jgi:hypothetical protein
VPDSVSYDLFISYSRRDNRQGRVSELAALIQKEYRDFTVGQELGIFFDTADIKGMDDWRHRILNAIRSTHLLLVCLSPDYLENEHCAWEVNEYLKHEATRSVLGDGIAPIYLVEIPGWSDKDFQPRAAEWMVEIRRRHHFDFRLWFDEGAAALKDPAIRAHMDDLGGRICNRLIRIRRVIDAKGNVDRHNEHFVGRTADLRRLRDTVGLGKTGVLTAVHGLGGVGKTALAIEYAYSFAHEYPGGRWQVQCEGREDLRVALCALAGVRDFEFEFTESEKRDLDLAFERVLRELKTRADTVKPDGATAPGTR